MNDRQKTRLHTKDNLVIANCDDYYVAVVKEINPYNTNARHVVIVREHGEIQREILAKSFLNKQKLLNFLNAIIPEYFLEKKIINQVNCEIYNLIKNNEEKAR